MDLQREICLWTMNTVKRTLLDTSTEPGSLYLATRRTDQEIRLNGKKGVNVRQVRRTCQRLGTCTFLRNVFCSKRTIFTDKYF